MANYYPEFGKLLNRYLNKEDRAPAWLAKQLRVSASTVTRWLNNGTRPGKAETVLQIADALNIVRSEHSALLEAAGYAFSARQIEEGESESVIADEHPVAPATPVPQVAPITPTTTRNRPFQVPANIQDFVGRQELLNAIQAKLQAGGEICILQGLGGVGKTAIAIHLAYALKDSFPDGILWANLENAVTDDQLNVSVIQSILSTFVEPYGRKLSEEHDLAVRSRILREVLANKRVLVILDNAHGTRDVDPLLPPTTGDCAVLITTRNRRMLGDRAASFEVATFTPAESISLLEEIIGSERVQQELRGAEQIIDLLDGLPLALQVVARDLAEMGGVTFLEYFEMLLEERSRLDALADWEDASKDVRASFELSYRRLPDDFQRYFAALSIFEGVDFSAEAAAAVTQLQVPKIKIRILGRFHALSLIEESQRQADQQAVRYRFHPLLRLFAQEKLAEIGTSLADLRERATVYYVNLASEQKQAMLHLDADRENIITALHWAQAAEDWSHFHQGIAALTHHYLGVVGYLDVRGFWQEARELLDALLTSPIMDTDAFQKAITSYKLGTFCLRLAQAAPANKYLEQSLVLLETLPTDEPTRLLQAQAYESLSQLALGRGDIEAARQWIERGLAALQPLDSDRARHEMGYLQIRQVPVLARSGNLPTALDASRQGLSLLPAAPTAARVSGLLNQGILHDIQGETEAALAYWGEGVELAQQLGDNRRLAQLWQNLSVAQVNAGRFVQAFPLAEKALAAYERIGDMSGAATIRSNLAEICIYLQQYEEAQAHLTQSLDLAHQLALPRTEVFALVNQTRWYLDKRQLAEAQSTLQQADNVRQQANEPLQEAEIHRLQAELALYQANYEEALRQTEAALAAAAENGEWKEQGAAWRLQADIWQVQGKMDEAQAAYQRSLDMLDKRNLFETARTQLALGQLYGQSETPEQAGPLLEAALTAFTELQVPHFAEQAREILGHSQLPLGEFTAAPKPELELESPVPIERAEADIMIPVEPASRFVQERKLKSGGHGDIFLGRDPLTGEPVAIKRLKPEIVTQDPDIVARFLQEAELLRRLDHPNIVKLLAVAETEAGTMIVMEYVPGGSLRDLLDKEPQLPLQRALDIALELADALARTHHLGIIHRDLKPANVLLAADGTPRLTDFGIARMTQRETRLTQSGSFLSTVAYLSPEAYKNQELDERHDIWAFGMMLYEMLAGQLPFTGDNPGAIIEAILTAPVPDLMKDRSDVPLKVVDLIEHMLSKEPAMRPRGMRQIAAELEAIQDSMPHA